MPTYTDVEFGTVNPTTGAVTKQTTLASFAPGGNALAIRFRGLPTNRDTFPVTFNLTIGAIVSSGITGALVYGVVNNYGPLSTSPAVPNPRWRRSEVPAGQFIIPNGTNIDIPITFYSNLIPGNVTTSFALNPAWALPGHDDQTAITFLIESLDLPETTGPAILSVPNGATLTTTDASGRTGLTGARYIVDHERMRGTGGLVCPKTGQWIDRTEAVRDGYTGLLVAPESYDPPEPRPLPRGWAAAQRDEWEGF